MFQRLVNAVFRDLIREKILLAYMNELIIPSSDIKNGIKNLERALATVSKAVLTINWKKYFLQ